MFETLFKKPLSGRADALSNYPLVVDVHAHILPNLDDGPSGIEQSISIIKGLHSFGYKKIIATPHVMSGFYDNSPEDILQSLYLMRGILKRHGIPVELEAAAEYYLDDNFFRLLKRGEVLTFGNHKKYLLFETSFITKPAIIIEAAIRIKQAGFIPVLAHPERYICLHSADVLSRLLFNGLLFQVNIGSLAGLHTKQAKEMAELLISKKMVTFFGSNCHNEVQLAHLKEAYELPYFRQAARENVLNNTLLDAPVVPLSHTLRASGWLH